MIFCHIFADINLQGCLADMKCKSWWEQNYPDKKYENDYEQLNLFVDYDELEAKKKKKMEQLEEEDKLQKTILEIKDKYGKNMVLKGHDFEEGGTTRERNKQIGGHKA